MAIPNGSGSPSWSSPWKDNGSYAVGSRWVGRSHQIASTTSTFAGSGTASGAWLATTVTFK